MSNRNLVDPDLRVWLDRRPYVVPTDATLGQYRTMIDDLVAADL